MPNAFKLENKDKRDQRIMADIIGGVGKALRWRAESHAQGGIGTAPANGCPISKQARLPT